MKFQVYQDIEGCFRFRLKTSSGELVLVSKKYKSKSECTQDIYMFQLLNNSDIQIIRTNESDGNLLFEIRDANGNILGLSQSYSSSMSREMDIQAIKRNGSTRNIEDLTISATPANDSASSPTL